MSTPFNAPGAASSNRQYPLDTGSDRPPRRAVSPRRDTATTNQPSMDRDRLSVFGTSRPAYTSVPLASRRDRPRHAKGRRNNQAAERPPARVQEPDTGEPNPSFDPRPYHHANPEQKHSSSIGFPALVKQPAARNNEPLRCQHQRSHRAQQRSRGRSLASDSLGSISRPMCAVPPPGPERHRQFRPEVCRRYDEGPTDTADP